MAAARNYTITLGAVDNVTKVLTRVNKHLADMGKPVARMNKALKQFGELSGFKRISIAFSNIGRSALEAFRSLSRMVPILSTIVGAASIAGVERLAEAFGNSSTHSKLMAASLGMPVRQLSILENMMRTTGGAASDMDDSIKGLQSSLAGVARQDPAFSQQRLIFEKLGIDATQAGYAAKNPNSQMYMQIVRGIRDRFKDTPATEQRVLNLVFGSAGPAMMGFTNQTNAEQDASQAAVVKHGPLTDAQASLGDKLRRSLTSVRQSFEGLGNSIMSSVSPALTSLLGQLSTYIDDNRDLITVQVKSWLDSAGVALRQFTGYLNSIDWERVKSNVRQWGNGIEWAAGKIGGMKSALVVAAAIMMGPFLSAVATATTALLAFAANPVGAVILAIAAFGVAGYELYNNWDTVWKKLSDLWTNNTGYIRTLVETFNALPVVIFSHWGTIEKFYNDMWDGIKSAFGFGWGYVKPIWQSMMNAAKWVGNSWIGRKLGLNGAGDLLNNYADRLDSLETGVVHRPSLPSGEQKKNADLIYQTALGVFHNPAKAAAVVAQAQAESSFDPKANPGDGSYGLFQYHDKGRLAAYQRRYGHLPTDGSVEEQTQFFLSELQPGGQYANVGAHLGSDAEANGEILSREDEQPKDVNGANARNRGRMAAMYLNSLGKNATIANTNTKHQVDGNVQVHINLDGLPGASVTAQSSGNAFGGPVRIAHAGAAS